MLIEANNQSSGGMIMKVTRRPWPLLVISVLAMSLLVTGCGAKDLVSVAGLDKADLYVGDRFGNKVKIETPEEFLKAFKAAKAVKEPNDLRSETEAEYVFYSGDKKVYYDALGKYLVFVEKGKKKVYSADLGTLLGTVEQLPPAVTAGFSDTELLEWLKDMSQVKDPAAMLFDRGGQIVLAIMGGQRPTDGYQIELERVSLQAGSLDLAVRLVPPQGDANDVISYPCAGFTLSKKADITVTMIVPSESGEEIIHVPLANVEEGQNIIFLRPERGSILTERVKMVGFARVFEASFTVEVEDGHNVLGIQQVTASQGGPGWGYFEFWMDLEPATSPFGTIIGVTYSAKDGSRIEEVKVPIGFGGK
jgi:hypothetical protein